MNQQNIAYKAALQWYLDQGVDEAVLEQPLNRFNLRNQTATPKEQVLTKYSESTPAQRNPDLVLPSALDLTAKALAAGAKNLDELRAAIASFEGLTIKKNATNLVFADGNPKARVMLIGEAPGADEDRHGLPFAGVSGQLLDRILASINLSRTADTPENSVYISNVLNWRPPGNRTPSPQEIALSLPFIEKHIDLVKPKILVLWGGVAAKTLLHNDLNISKLRGTFHEYIPQTIENAAPIPTIATYHPTYLLRTPGQKKAVWHDMLRLQDRLRQI